MSRIKTFKMLLLYSTFVFRSYNVNNFLDDLKVLYRMAGREGKGVSFIFSDNDIKDEAFLEFINNMLSAGEVSIIYFSRRLRVIWLWKWSVLKQVANLFPRDEMDEILDELIPVMKKENPKIPPTSDNLYSYFLSRSRNNLHIVLCFSPVGTCTFEMTYLWVSKILCWSSFLFFFPNLLILSLYCFCSE